jgi:hypothetical protein
MYKAEFLLLHTNIVGCISSHKVIQVVQSENGYNYIRKVKYSGRNKDWSYVGKQKAGSCQ